MVSNVAFDLKKSAYVPVDLGDAVKGNIKIEYGADNSQVVIDYDLRVALVGGILQDTLPLFPTFGNFSSQLDKLYVAHLSRLGIQLPPIR
jgi:hypothetical protein